MRRLAVSLTVLLLGMLAVIPAGADTSSTSTSTTSPTLAAKTLYVGLPGPFTGCDYLDSSVNETTQAILDLIRPSAFTTTSNGELLGAGGPIASAELTSLSPQTVTYTIAPGSKWSNGVAFTADDLYHWWLVARGLASVSSDGYRAISSMIVSNAGMTVVAKFSAPYADWQLLFRDVEPMTQPTNCSVSDWVHRPSLGPYRVLSASSTRVVLKSDPAWSLDAGRFGTIVLQSSGTINPATTAEFLNYTQDVSSASAKVVSSQPSLQSHIGSTDANVELVFAPGTNLTSSLAIRQFLSQTLDRSHYISALWGNTTFLPAPGASALYSQGETNYPGPSTGGVSTSTVVASSNSDCVSCGNAALIHAGWRRLHGTWWRSGVELPLAIVAVGPTAVERSSAQMVAASWRNDGVRVEVQQYGSDVSAARAGAENQVDAVVLLRTTGLRAVQAARSWYGTVWPDALSTGLNSTQVSNLATQAESLFNPTDANVVWGQLDDLLTSTYRIRPLYTPPYLMYWSSNLSGVSGSFTLQGLLDELPTWEITTPTA